MFCTIILACCVWRDQQQRQVFCTPSMASFLRNNQPWAQLMERGNISIRETDPAIGDSDSGTAFHLSSTISVLPVDVPHRAELSDTVAYLISMTKPSTQHVNVERAVAALAPSTVFSSSCESEDRSEDGRGGGENARTMKLFYCPDTDGWSGWRRSIRDWCEEVDVALLDATFYDKQELKGRDMSEVISRLVERHFYSQDLENLRCLRRYIARRRAPVCRTWVHHAGSAIVISNGDHQEPTVSYCMAGTWIHTYPENGPALSVNSA